MLEVGRSDLADIDGDGFGGLDAAVVGGDVDMVGSIFLEGTTDIVEGGVGIGIVEAELRGICTREGECQRVVVAVEDEDRDLDGILAALDIERSRLNIRSVVHAIGKRDIGLDGLRIGVGAFGRSIGSVILSDLVGYAEAGRLGEEIRCDEGERTILGDGDGADGIIGIAGALVDTCGLASLVLVAVDPEAANYDRVAIGVNVIVEDIAYESLALDEGVAIVVGDRGVVGYESLCGEILEVVVGDAVVLLDRVGRVVSVIGVHLDEVGRVHYVGLDGDGLMGYGSRERADDGESGGLAVLDEYGAFGGGDDVGVGSCGSCCYGRDGEAVEPVAVGIVGDETELRALGVCIGSFA